MDLTPGTKTTCKDASPGLKLPMTPKSKILRRTSSKSPMTPKTKILSQIVSASKMIDKYKEMEKREQTQAQLRARIVERRKLSLHYVLKAKHRLQRIEKSIRNQQVGDREVASPLDQVVEDVIREHEFKEVIEVAQQLQKHIDGIQVLCAKLKKKESAASS